MLKPSSFSPILAIIGVAMLTFSKNDKKKDIASILVGFAVLMFGMDSMSGAVAPLKDVPEFAEVLLWFKTLFWAFLQAHFLPLSFSLHLLPLVSFRLSQPQVQ